MTWPYSNSFKLIKAYQKHSKTYKSCTNYKYKNVLLKKWTRDIMDNELLIESTPYKNHGAFCQMCLSVVTINEYLCCNECLFPIIDYLEKRKQLTPRQQLYTFVFLSICYWKEAVGSTFGENEKLIWIHRFRIAWESADTPFVCYFAPSTICLQCSINNKRVIKKYDTNKKLVNFNVDYFCYNCFFPLFDILIYV
ncbi:Mv-ORF37 peptide [Maruca vitrata nucleopolyhedrovirus]|uniref:Mv-ORF37 peptide n=1 Tax=Maruca vitrata nucleopolyhedrovirus TaxID=1307954 RepID=A1YR99_9ABAC|nr:Mv-ORF37 peptide [Maruca vitrata nucleopolyhedrovirus]ABL75989.1 Mv-ORF37 peptide [Maruca vitrata nucleopolyhedrovirus]